MYDWVTHTWSPIIGCSHQCSYCYVTAFRVQPPVPLMDGPLPNLGKGRTIFVGHLCDLFAEAVPDATIYETLEHCMWYDNTYVFQTKNPARLLLYLNSEEMPEQCMVGTTIETNRQETLDRISKAPNVVDRASALRMITVKKFITIEPILDFDPGPFVDMIHRAEPDFVNIGADSKKHNLPEPSLTKVWKLIDSLGKAGIEIKKKTNLERLFRKGERV